MSSGIFKVIAKFTDSKGNPITNTDLRVKLFDKDRFLDDKLGEATLDSNGEAHFLVFIADILSIDSPDERTPDLYFVLKKDGKEIFRSETFEEVNFETENPVTQRSEAVTQTFGPFVVEI